MYRCRLGLRAKPANCQNRAGDLLEAVKSSSRGEILGGKTPKKVKVLIARKEHTLLAEQTAEVPVLRGNPKEKGHERQGPVTATDASEGARP
jgi:hypothetical protein